ncbi:MAG: GTPase HflX, partial [Leptospiraceae bacterium]|nr:GTPase HflX [Leptospiraceae bacterium]
MRPESIVSQEFARQITALSGELGRQIGVLVDRQGHVLDTMVGDDSRIWIPSLGRERAQRLRGLRLIHTHLKKEPLTEEDLSDLTLLRLDAACAITVDEHGLPEHFHLAYIAPG